MLAKNELWHFFQLAEQGGSMFGPHGVPGGAAPSKLEAAQEQYNVAGGNYYFEKIFLKNSLDITNCFTHMVRSNEISFGTKIWRNILIYYIAKNKLSSTNYNLLEGVNNSEFNPDIHAI